MSNLANSNNISKNIQMGASRGRLILTSMNTSRELSIQSNTSSMTYHDHMDIQNNNPNWANHYVGLATNTFPQVPAINFNLLSLSYRDL